MRLVSEQFVLTEEQAEAQGVGVSPLFHGVAHVEAQVSVSVCVRDGDGGGRSRLQSYVDRRKRRLRRDAFRDAGKSRRPQPAKGRVERVLLKRIQVEMTQLEKHLPENKTQTTSRIQTQLKL